MWSAGSFHLVNVASSEIAGDVKRDIAQLLENVVCGDHFVIEVVPYGPHHFPMDYLDKDYAVLAKVYQSTDPRKSRVGVLICWKDFGTIPEKLKENENGMPKL